MLEIAIQLAAALHYLNGQRIIHKDIKPDNILIHPETRQIQLIDFSIASLLPKERQQLTNPMDSPNSNLPVVNRYLTERRPASLLCLPLLDRTQLCGVLYLENQAASGVFHAKRLAALNLLATQAAISLENADFTSKPKTTPNSLKYHSCNWCKAKRCRRWATWWRVSPTKSTIPSASWGEYC